MKAKTIPKSTDDYNHAIDEAANYVKDHLGTADVAVVLGSGLSHFDDKLKNKKPPLAYNKIPHMLLPSVSGHPGELILGEIAGAKILCLKGRSHAYEGICMYENTFTARLMQRIGCKIFVASNSSGGAVEGMKEGGMLVIRDHINFFHRNPLAETYENPSLGKRHADLYNLYSSRLANIALNVAKDNEIDLFEGIYASTSGPTYETPAEVRYCHKFGAGAFGMSTVPETTAASAVGMEVIGFSLCTNMAAGMSDETLTHDGVKAVATLAGDKFMNFMEHYLQELIKRDIIRKDLSDDCPATAIIADHHNAPLPQTTFPVSPQSEINTAMHQVQEIFDTKDSHLSTLGICCYGCGSRLPELLETSGDVKEIFIKDLYRMPVVSASAREGRLLCGRITKEDSTTSNRVIVLEGIRWEGFVCEEATYLARLLAVLGVRHLIHAFVVSETSKAESSKIGCGLVNDCMEFSTIHPVAQNKPLLQYYSHRVIDSTILKEHFDKVRIAEDFQEIPSSSLMAFPGPSLPTKAEIALAKDTGFSICTLTSLSLLFASSSAGIANTGVGVTSGTPNPGSFGAISRVIKSLSVSYLLDKGSDVAVPCVETGSLPVQYTGGQVTYHLPQPIIQGDPCAIKETASNIRQQLLGEKDSKEELPKIALVVDEPQVWSSIEKNNFTFKSAAEFESSSILPDSFKILLGSWKQDGDDPTMILCIPNSYFVSEGRTSSQITAGIRLLGELGVQRIVFVNLALGCSSSQAVGDILLIEDHVNFSGRNPLFGHNVDEWGVRFLDSSSVYSLNNKLEETKIVSLCKRGINGLFVGPLFYSPATAQFASEAGCDVITTSTIPEIITAQHMSLNLVCFSVIRAVMSDDSSTVKDELQSSLVNLGKYLGEVFYTLKDI